LRLIYTGPTLAHTTTYILDVGGATELPCGAATQHSVRVTLPHDATGRPTQAEARTPLARTDPIVVNVRRST